MITEDQVGSALTYLAETAVDWAQAKGRRVWLEEKRKVIKAQLFASAPDGTIQSRESWAYAHKDYADHLSELREAVEAEETLRAYRAAAEARIEVWRSLESSRRAANVR